MMAENVESSSTTEEKLGISMESILTELYTNPVNLVLLAICVFLLYKILFQKRSQPKIKVEPELPPLKKQDFTLEQLRQYDGKVNSDGRVLIAVNGKVFDVTKGKRFYGPGAPYGVFAGRDASRGLATFSLTEDVLREEHDDLSDLNSMQMESVKEWEMQFTEKYLYVGKLLMPGEAPTEYSDTEEDSSAHEKSKSE